MGNWILGIAMLISLICMIVSIWRMAYNYGYENGRLQRGSHIYSNGYIQLLGMIGVVFLVAVVALFDNNVDRVATKKVNIEKAGTYSVNVSIKDSSSNVYRGIHTFKVKIPCN